MRRQKWEWAYYYGSASVARVLGAWGSILPAFYRSKEAEMYFLSRRPVFWLAILFTLGVVLGETCSISLGFASLFLLASVIVSAWGLLLYRRIPPILQASLVLTIGIVVLSRGVPPNPLSDILERPATISGVVAEVRSVEEERIRLTLSLREVHLTGQGRNVTYRFQGGLFHPVPKAALNVYLPRQTTDASLRLVKDLVPGRVLSFTGALGVPSDSGNPGMFDYRAYLRRQGVTYSLSTSSAKLTTQALSGYGVKRRAFQVGRFIRKQVSALLPPPFRGLAVGILLGDTDDIDPKLLETFRKAGISHLLSVSGLHVALVCSLLFYGAKVVRAPVWAQAVVAAGGTLGFVLVVGWKASAWRAAIASLCALTATTLGRKTDPLSALGISAFVILGLSPLMAFDAGFQLSYAAVLGILLLAPRLKTFFAWPIVGDGLAVSIAASLATLPIVLRYFYTVSLVGPIVNLLAVPLTSFLIPLVIAGTVWQSLGLFGTKLVSQMLSGLFIGVVRTAGFAAQFPFSAITTGCPGAISISLYYCGLLWGWRKAEGIVYQSARGRKGTLLKLALAILAWCLWLPLSVAQPWAFSVTAIDVGQGDSFLIHRPGDLTCLIDGGGADPRYSDFDIGERITVPFLQRLGLSRVDVVVSTHPHLDHVGGLISVLKGLEWKSTVDNGSFYSRWAELARRETCLSMTRDSLAIRGGDISIQVWQPLAQRSAGENDRSLATKVTYGSWSFLFTGDLEETGVEALLTLGKDVTADVLQIPHHGAWNTSLSRLISRVRPKLALISVGRNQFGHPHPATLEALDRSGVTVLRTDLDGSIRFLVLNESRGEVSAPAQLRVETGRGRVFSLTK